jgi:hypothetical protein
MKTLTDIFQEEYERTGRGGHDRRKRLRRFGLEPEDYDAMLEAQGGVCAICGQPETVVRYGQVQPLSVDHDHKTGQVRGLLCHRCNIRVGWVEFEPPAELLRYLGRTP